MPNRPPDAFLFPAGAKPLLERLLDLALRGGGLEAHNLLCEFNREVKGVHTEPADEADKDG